MWMQHKNKNRQSWFIQQSITQKSPLINTSVDIDLHNVDLRIICEALNRGQIWLNFIHKLSELDMNLEIV